MEVLEPDTKIVAGSSKRLLTYWENCKGVQKNE